MTDVDLDRLSSVQDAFDKASDTDPDPFALPEPGDYGATVDSFDIIDSSKGLLFKTTLTIINDQQYAGRQVDTIHNLEDQKRIDYLKSHLAKLGANTAGIRLAEDLRPGSDFLRGLLDVVVEIAIKDSKKINPNTDKPYRNVFVNQRIGSVSDIPGPATDDFVHPNQGSMDEDGDIKF